jgi:hypothetical protein
MQAAPPPEAQVLPETEEQMVGPAAGRAAAKPAPAPKPAHLRPAEPVAEPVEAGPRPAPSAEASTETADTETAGTGTADTGTADAASTTPMADVDAAGATVPPRRPVIQDAGRSRADVPWLGIGSWLLLCAALFASLVGWPDQTALDRVTALWSNVIPSETLTRGPAQGESASLPADKQPAVTPSPGHEQGALPPTELAPPIRSEAPGGTADPAAGSPPLPRFKPSLDRVAAKFSNAFLEFGEQLQQQGDFDAAVHMRRQGSNLDPWKAPRASNL